MKRTAELRQMSDEQLHERIKECTLSLQRLRGFNKAQYGSSNPMMMRNLRKNKARCLTILRERELARSKPE
jgi:large subunit ribosomal protein L29